VVLLDGESRILLFEGRDLSDPEDGRRWWCTPGGGVGETESLEETAIREVWEETGHRIDRLSGPIARLETSFGNHGVATDQVEHFFAARVDAIQVHDRGWTELERAAVTDWRWWTREQLVASRVVYYPQNLLELLTRADELLGAEGEGRDG
jgi:8-oxo-dGTP pyrophosphatase MutT (NUDIX family)